VVTWRNTDYAPSRANLTFVQAADGSWQTSGVDAAIATGAAKSLIDRIGKAWPGVPRARRPRNDGTKGATGTRPFVAPSSVFGSGYRENP
jgi:hypothetical protein